MKAILIISVVLISLFMGYSGGLMLYPLGAAFAAFGVVFGFFGALTIGLYVYFEKIEWRIV